MASGQILSIAQVSSLIELVLENDPYLSDVWIEAEARGVFVSGQGHVYFDLIDDKQLLRSVIFRNRALLQRYQPRDGDRVTVHGHLAIYAPKSQYQLIADTIQPAGVGLQALELERLRQQLESEGLFDPARKRPLPAWPRVIGVVTSPDGAVWHDIQRVVERRFPLAELCLSPSPVQGAKAPAMLVAALQRLVTDGRADVIILARGGGSADDLAAFNDEGLARAIFASPVPVVSAVGHETDWTIADMVADLRAPTPSVAAERCTPDRAELRDAIAAAQAGLADAVGEWIAGGRRETDRARLRMSRRLPDVPMLAQSVDQLSLRGDRALTRMVRLRRDAIARGQSVLVPRRLGEIAAARRREWRFATATLARQRTADLDRRRTPLRTREERLRRAARSEMEHARGRESRAELALELLSPLAVLHRGYAIVHRAGEDGPVTSVGDLRAGDVIATRFADGQADARVERITETERNRA